MTDNSEQNDLAKEVQALRGEVAKLNDHAFIRLHDNLWKLGLFQLYRGLAFGLGSVMGATILVSVAAYILAQIDFIPIIGDWALDLARQIDADNAESYGVNEDGGDAPAAPDGTGGEGAAQNNPSPGTNGAEDTTTPDAQ